MGLLTTRIKCGDSSFTHYYLRPYFPQATGKDLLSLSLLKFKQRTQPDLDAWIACSAELLRNLSFSPDTIILRALRHDETTTRPEFPSALDLLGQTLATSLHCRYSPSLLSKTQPTLPGKLLTRRQRYAQLQDVYRFTPTPPKTAQATAPEPPLHSNPIIIPYAPPTDPNPTPFLLIDDILTTGATMLALIRTLRNYHPACPIVTFTLTRANYHFPILPQAAEHEIYSFEALKSLISANSV